MSCSSPTFAKSFILVTFSSIIWVQELMKIGINSIHTNNKLFHDRKTFGLSYWQQWKVCNQISSGMKLPLWISFIFLWTAFHTCLKDIMVIKVFLPSSFLIENQQKNWIHIWSHKCKDLQQPTLGKDNSAPFIHGAALDSLKKISVL